MSSWKDRELTGLRQVHWIQEQILSRQDPITGKQLYRFGKNPNVIIPDRAVELRRLPAEYKYIREPLLMETGELAFLAKRDGHHIVVVGDCTFKLRDASFWGARPDLGKYHLLGVTKGVPFCVVSHLFQVGDDFGVDLWNDLRADWELRFGDQVLFKTQGVEALLLLRDGSLIYCVRADEKNTYKIMKFSNGQEETIVERETRPIKRFVETADGTVWCFCLCDDHKTWVCGSLRKDGLRYLGSVVDVVETSQGTRWVRQFGSSHPELGEFRVPEKLQDFFSAKRLIGEPGYISSYTEFADGQRYAYIGWARHQQQRWVVDGVPQPACNWVSRFFQHPTHGLCYLGLVGHHLLTMQVPSVTEKR